MALCFSSLGMIAGCHASSTPTEEVPEPSPVPQEVKTVEIDLPPVPDFMAVNEADRAALREVFSEFKRNVQAYRGREAAQMLSASSLQYYEKLLETARIALHRPRDYEAIAQKLSPSIRTNVELILSRLSAEFIESADAVALYEVAFNQGWIGYKTLSTASIDNFTSYQYRGHRYITADFYYEGTVEDRQVMRIAFVRENDAWKVDLTPILVAVDQTIQKFAASTGADADLSLQRTVDNAQKSLEPENWSVYTQKNDGFSIKFPREPMRFEDGETHIYTSQHYRYGQFDVRTRAFRLSEVPADAQKKAVDREIMAFLKPIGAGTPSCRQEIAENYRTIRCAFEVASHDSQGVAVWVFASDRVYLLFNLARRSSFHPDVASKFLGSFAF